MTKTWRPHPASGRPLPQQPPDR